MVRIEAPGTPECQEGISSQGGQWWEEDTVVHYVQEEHIKVTLNDQNVQNEQ